MPIVKLEDEDGTTNEVEVPADNIDTKEDEDVVIKQQEELNKSFSSRATRAERKALEKVGLDPDRFKGEDGYDVDEDTAFQTLAEKRGIELREDGKPKGSVKDEKLQELKQKASKAESLEEKVNQYEQEIQQTREERLENTLLENAPPTAGENAKETFLTMAKREMVWDDEYGWVATDEDGEIAYDAGDPVGPKNVIGQLEDTHDFLFESTEVDGGPNVSPGSNAGGKKTWTEEEHANANPAKMDDETYQDWLTAADEDRIR